MQGLMNRSHNNCAVFTVNRLIYRHTVKNLYFISKLNAKNLFRSCRFLFYTVLLHKNNI